jgi:myo-inositol-1(or 4)-monophosphatase
MGFFAMNVVTRAAPGFNPEIDRREAFCLDMVRSAGRIALEGFANLGATVKSMKGKQDFLTETDGAVERHIKAGIAAAFPGDGFLGEESGGVIKPSLWVVDPIDGTANFARGIPHFCISVAYVLDGIIELGVIYNPALDELYAGRRGRGATRDGQSIRVAQTADYDSACIELGWSTRIPDEDYVEALRKLLALGANVRRNASGALGLAYVADGRSDAYAELHMNSWDCLAGLLLVREAGGVVGPYLAIGGLRDGGPVIACCPGIAAGVAEATSMPLET